MHNFWDVYNSHCSDDDLGAGRGLFYDARLYDFERTDEFEKKWKEVVEGNPGTSSTFSWCGYGKLRNVRGRIVGVPAKIRSYDLSNTSPELYRYTTPLRN
jgi:hypothetical protein